jgi:hypothetical protein
MKTRQLTDVQLVAEGVTRRERGRFQFEACCVTSLYRYSLMAEDLRVGYWKLLVRCMAPKTETALPAFEECAGIMYETVRFDFARHWAADDDTRKRRMLDAIHRGARRASAHFHVPLAPFERARTAVLARKFRNTFITQQKWDRRRKRVARVECEHGLRAFRAWLAVYEGETCVQRELAFQTKPSERLFVPKLGPLRWTGDGTRRVELFSRRGERVAHLDVRNRVAT